MLADVTSNIQRLLTPRDFGYSDNKSSISQSTGTASALILFNREWIDVDADQAWFWTEEWQAGERKVDEYIREGNVQTFDTIEDFLNTLRG